MDVCKTHRFLCNFCSFVCCLRFSCAFFCRSCLHSYRFLWARIQGPLNGCIEKQWFVVSWQQQRRRNKLKSKENLTYGTKKDQKQHKNIVRKRNVRKTTTTTVKKGNIVTLCWRKEKNLKRSFSQKRNRQLNNTCYCGICTVKRTFLLILRADGAALPVQLSVPINLGHIHSCFCPATTMAMIWWFNCLQKSI